MGIVTCKGGLVTSRIQHTLYAKIVNLKLLQWYSEKFSILEYLIADNVHWRSVNLARKESRFSLSTFINKWISGDTATGRVIVQKKN